MGVVVHLQEPLEQASILVFSRLPQSFGKLPARLAALVLVGAGFLIAVDDVVVASVAIRETE